MASNKIRADLIKFLEDAGFNYSRTNSKNRDFYTHSDHGEVGISVNIDDRAAREVTVRIQRSIGQMTQLDKSKSRRHTKASNQRQRVVPVTARVKRERANQRRIFGVLADVCTPSELEAIARRMNKNYREFSRYRQEMR